MRSCIFWTSCVDGMKTTTGKQRNYSDFGRFGLKKMKKKRPKRPKSKNNFLHTDNAILRANLKRALRINHALTRNMLSEIK